MYKFNCLRCESPVESNDEADFDGEGFCEGCKSANKEIAKKVDEQIAARRANKPGAEFVNPMNEVLKKRKNSTTYFKNGQII